MPRSIAVIGVPTSAGAHHAGQDQAPRALRERGLLTGLREAGLDVVDVGDVAGEVWQPDAADAEIRNIEAVVRVARAVAGAVQEQTAHGRIPLLVGGDCTITVGVVAGLRRSHDDVRLAYFDGDADLSSPHRTRSGVLDASGVAHLLGIADTALSRIGDRFPLLREDEITLLGYDPTDHDSFDEAALQQRPLLVHASDSEVGSRPDAVARRALDAIDRPQARIVVHFDVDAVDSRDLALANYPHYGTGVPLATAARVLEILFATPRLGAIVLTEVNPTHDPHGSQLDRYVDAVTGALRTATHQVTASGVAAAQHR